MTSEYHRQWRERNQDYGRRRYQKDPESSLAQSRQYYAKNAEKRKAKQREWRKRNPDKVRRQTDARRARRTGAFVEDVDRLTVFKRDGWMCQQCGVRCPPHAAFPDPDFATLDHVVALASGGEHSYANAQTLCLRCNCRKGTS